MKILDLSAGRRAIWFNKNHPDAVYLDIRQDVCPTFVCDTTKLPDVVGHDYDLLVFDPPHVNTGSKSNSAKIYGHQRTAQIRDLIKASSKEAARVSTQEALMAFKWNDHDMRLALVLELMPDWEPLFGHYIAQSKGGRSTTYWVLLKRRQRHEELTELRKARNGNNTCCK